MKEIEDLKESIIDLTKRIEKLERKSWKDMPLIPSRKIIEELRIEVNKITEEGFQESYYEKLIKQKNAKKNN